jgi:hypothetical protein
MSSRAEKAKIAAQLRSHGLVLREIAEHLGISISYAQGLVADPDGTKERARRQRYRQPCPGCGRLMDGSNGRSRSPKHCHRCAPKAATIWTRERIIDAIQDYAEQYGRPPSATEWSPHAAIRVYRDDIAERFYEDGCWPSTVIVQTRFGSWNAAIAAAGFSPLKTGHKHTDIAASYGVSTNSIYHALKRMGVPRRTLSDAQRIRGRRGYAA